MTKTQRIGLGIAGGFMLLLFYVIINQQTIKSAELGIVRSFGVVQPQALRPGFHIKAPWQSVEIISTSFSDTNFVEAGDGNESTIHCLTKDGITVGVPVSVTWTIVPETVTMVKARLPGYYTDRQYVIIRAAVRDAVSQFSVTDGSVFDRPAVQAAITREIKKQTVEYYLAQGFGPYSNRIVRYGKIALRGVFPPDEISAKTEQVVSARLEALAAAARTQVPSKQSVNDYTRVLQAQAVARAAADGKANVTIVSGNVPVVATAGPK